MRLDLGRVLVWVLISGKRKADVARPKGRPFDQILARKSDKCQRLADRADRAVKARDKGRDQEAQA